MAENGIFLNNLPLLLDWQQQVKNFTAAQLPIDQIPHSPAIHATDSRNQHRRRAKDFVNLPRPNYPPALEIGINELYWPTGATRWANGLFLASEATKYALVSAAASNAELTLRAETNGRELTAKVHLLAPRPITSVEGNQLWLLPIVDARYWWQFRPVTLALTKDSEWYQVIQAIGTAIGKTIIHPAVPTDYLRPDPTELSRKHHNAAMLLDAVAHSLGWRVVYRPDGTVRLLNAAQSLLLTEANLETNQRIMGGEKFDPHAMPASVAVVFRRTCEFYAECEGTWTVAIENQAATSDKATGTTLAIHSTAFAKFHGEDSTPANATELTALAQQIATDWLANHARQYDISFAGIQPWTLTGIDDCLIYRLGTELDSVAVLHQPDPAELAEIRHESERVFSTRAISLPENFGVQHQLSQGSSPLEFGEPTGWITIRNDTCQTRPKGEVLAFREPLPSVDTGEIKNISCVPFVGIRPVIDSAQELDDTGQYAVLVDDIEPCETGRAIISGGVMAFVSRNYPTDRFAEVANGLHVLVSQSERGSAQILWHDGTPAGESGIAFVRLSNARETDDGPTTTTTQEDGPTTTTTAGDPPPCVGQCRMVWDGAEWHPDPSNSSCAVGQPGTTTTLKPTTTTSEPPTTTTGGPTTTTTPCEPCDGPITTTTGDGTTTTLGTTTTDGPTTTTTAEEPDCECQIPDWCGSEIGECAWMPCVSGVVNEQPNCTGTTTTTLPPSTTTTCDCATTTTWEGGECEWCAGFGGGGVGTLVGTSWCGQNLAMVWRLKSGCAGTCQAPEGAPTSCDDVAFTPCNPPPPCVPPPPPLRHPCDTPDACGGLQRWLFVANPACPSVVVDPELGGLGWTKLADPNVTTCCQCNLSPSPLTGSSKYCWSPSPSEDGQCLEERWTPCLPTGNTAPPPPPHNCPDCWQCYTTTTTGDGTTTPGTTTTPDPCAGAICRTRWNPSESDWDIEYSECDEVECPCLLPNVDGADDCDVRTQPCLPPPPTTTTAPPTTTTAAPTTTTTPATTTTEEPVGVCCDSEGQCAELTEAVCGDGTWFPEGSCAENPCTGACCFDNSEIMDCMDNRTESECDALRGIEGLGAWHYGKLCSEVECEPTTTTTGGPTTTTTEEPEGACCDHPLGCDQYTESDCVGAGGDWRGPDSDCEECPTTTTTEPPEAWWCDEGAEPRECRFDNSYDTESPPPLYESEEECQAVCNPPTTTTTEE